MKRLMILAGVMLLSSPLFAGTVRYLQDAQFDKKASFGISGTSDAILEFDNETNSNVVTLRSTDTDANYTLYLPTATGTAGQFLRIDANGVLFFADETSVTGFSTFTVNDILDMAGGMIESSTHTDITVNYDPSGQLNIAVGTNVVRFADIDTIGELEVITSTDIVTNGEGGISLGSTTIQNLDVNANLDVTGNANVGGQADIAGTANVGGDVKIDRDQKYVFDGDDNSDTYILQESATDDIRFFRNGVEYMRFE